MRNKFTIDIVANCAQGPLLSGGDRIFIEFSKRWGKQGHRVNIYTWEEGMAMCKRNNLVEANIVLWPLGRLSRLGFPWTYFLRIINGVISAFKIPSQKGKVIIYSASDFWPDSLPAFIMHKRLKSSRWVAGFYLFAPNPFRGFKHGGNFKPPVIKDLIYYLSQRPAFWLIKKFADKICVTSEPDIQPFIKAGRKKSDMVVVSGGVNVEPVKNYLRSKKEKEGFYYDGCFMGRFHPQKGIVELIDIWSLVCQKRPGAKLVLIGDGSLRGKIEEKIHDLKLSANVSLLGYLGDGEKKYEIFRRSRIMLHPALYDSGGMSAWEGMVWGRPGVGFDLPALKTYYQKGMLKAKIGNKKLFAEAILLLLNNQKLYRQMAEDAQRWAFDVWDWDKRAQSFLERMN